ncbi:MAG: NUDIX hydrolase [Lachnospiraceae bacterium]|nr:NUDIX hydrolase [Lachnospiraceae bacterium]
MSKDRNKQHFTDIRRLTDNPFLNLYEMDALASSGAPFHYYFASRRKDENIRIRTGKLDPEGVLVYAIDENDPNRILMVYQYRYPVDRNMYELPAGLIEAGETPEEAGAREILEETGMIFTPVHVEGAVLTRPYMLAQGISDETGVNVFGTVKGELSTSFQEDTEYIKPMWADKKEVKRILSSEVTSMRAQLLLSMFLHSDENDPFAFLR